MSTANTADWALAVLPTTTSAAAPEVTVEKPSPAFSTVPLNAFSWSVAFQTLDPFWPSRLSVPLPKLATSVVGVSGDAATAVPPVVVVWKSQPARSTLEPLPPSPTIT